METIISNQIYIKNPSQAIIDFCYDELIIDNPTYIQMLRLGKEDTIRRKHIPQKINLFVVSGDRIILPFGCLHAIWNLIKNSPYQLKFNNNGPISFRNDTITQPLYNYQEKAVQTMVSAKGGVLIGGCASGKTNCGIEIVKRIGKRFLWLTHTIDLVNQSYQRFKKLYPECKIAITSDGKVEFGEDGTIATVQTMSKLDPNLYANEFDVVIVDECHRCTHDPISAKMFGRVVSNVSARYKFGLTATPKRNDTLTKTIYTTLGANLNGEFMPEFVMPRNETKTLLSKHIKVPLQTPFLYEALADDGTFDYAALVDALAENMPRNETIVENIVELQKDGRKQLVLCSRVTHCELLGQMLKDKGIKVEVLTGSSRKKQRKEILEHPEMWDVLIATFSLAKEGLDLIELDTLHWCSIVGNKTDTIQSAGRIERICEGKKEPIIFDYVDVRIPYVVSRYNKRVTWLRKRDE